MTAIRRLAAHDPLPGGHSVVLMRRLAADDPDGTVLELIVTNPDGSEETETPVGPDGNALSLEAAVGVAMRRANEEGLKRIWLVDRTEGAREGAVLAHGGDHSFPGETLADDDMEDGERGADMRDIDINAAPRRF
jgi:hypothetical protein